jgi:hypothetical protein
MQHQINLTPITLYTQLLRAAELSQQKEIKIPIQQARLISMALNEMLDKINTDYSRLYDELKNKNTDSITVSMDGGGFDKQ